MGKIIGTFFLFVLKITRYTGHFRVPQIFSLSLFAIHEVIYIFSFSFKFITSRSLEDEQGNTKPSLQYLSRSWLLCNQVCMYICIFVEFPFVCKLLHFYKDWIDKY